MMVSKTPQEELIEPVATEMLSFLQEGTINPEFVEENLEFKGIDRIQDLESIFRIHFVLSDEVVEFLEKLPERVRRIKTESEKQEIRRKGEIRGRINWKKTITEQKSTCDDSLFISQNPSKNYDVPENLVLKKVLSIIHTVINKDLEKPLEKEYNWLGKLKEDKKPINHLKNVYRKNVHINRIKNPTQYNITKRDISKAENSRKELYKEAAKLLIKYQNLIQGNYNKEELKKLLKETLILPGDAPTLYELYSVFKILCKIKQNFKLQKIEEGQNQIAIFKKQNEKILAYHNSTGNMKFREEIEGLNDKKSKIEQLERYRKSLVRHDNVLEKLFGKSNKPSYSGRPDLLIEHYKENKLKRLIIGEVKYSDKKTVFSKGLKQLIQYIHFSRKNNKYSLGNIDMEGILIQDKQEFLNQQKLKETGKIKNINFISSLEVLDTEKLNKYKYEE